MSQQLNAESKMNCYLHVEISERELDSKLLLAVVAASRGHDTLIGDVSSLDLGLRSRCFNPGVYHTKSLAPTPHNIKRHQWFKDNCFLITSIDEEGGLINYGYERFALARYSDESLGLASAAFCWGSEDTETLQRIYRQHAYKIYNTGSPRADLWRPKFAGYWAPSRQMPDRPYLLISSNMGSANNIRPFYEIVRSEKTMGYYERDPTSFLKKFDKVAEDYEMTGCFVEAIKYLSENQSEFDIVLRPHPVENVEAWKCFLEGIPNVYVVRDGSISAWVNNAFAVMHNGCTTALEATISGKLVITYLPFKQKYARDLPNDLGVRVFNAKELLSAVSEAFDNYMKSHDEVPALVTTEIVENKITIDENRLAAEKMVDVWEKLGTELTSQSTDWFKYKRVLRYRRLKKTLVHVARRLLPGGLGKNKTFSLDYFKFSPLDQDEMKSKVVKIQKILGLDGQVTCKSLDERVVLIRPKK